VPPSAPSSRIRSRGLEGGYEIIFQLNRLRAANPLVRRYYASLQSVRQGWGSHMRIRFAMVVAALLGGCASKSSEITAAYVIAVR
jgi:hypothetical protein